MYSAVARLFGSAVFRGDSSSFAPTTGRVIRGIIANVPGERRWDAAIDMRWRSLMTERHAEFYAAHLAGHSWSASPPFSNTLTDFTFGRLLACIVTKVRGIGTPSRRRIARKTASESCHSIESHEISNHAPQDSLAIDQSCSRSRRLLNATETTSRWGSSDDADAVAAGSSRTILASAQARHVRRYNRIRHGVGSRRLLS